MFTRHSRQILFVMYSHSKLKCSSEDYFKKSNITDSWTLLFWNCCPTYFKPNRSKFMTNFFQQIGHKFYDFKPYSVKRSENHSRWDMKKNALDAEK